MKQKNKILCIAITVVMLFSLSAKAAAQQLKLGSNITRFDSSAALEIESQKFTLLLSRINDTTTIVKSVRDGSMIYFNNVPASGQNKGLYVRSGNKWNWAWPASAANNWALPGNSGTNSGSYFLGTTDNQPLLLKTNNLIRVFIDSTTGNTGFRTLTPAATLHNQGATLLGMKSIFNLPTGAYIGAAANTVDSFTVFSVAQTTADQTFFLPPPTRITAGRIAILVNTGSVYFYVGPARVDQGNAVTLVWTGTAWQVVGDGIGAGAFTVPNRYVTPSSLGIMLGAGNNMNSGASGNIAIGVNAQQAVDDADKNIAIGTGTLEYNGGNSNIAIGYLAHRNGSGGSTIAIGRDALGNSTTPNPATAVGYGALKSNINGNYNTALGYMVLGANTNGNQNTAVGYNALANAGATGSDNSALGFEAAYQVNGDRNTAIGAYALRNVVNGSNNTAIGYAAGYIGSATTISNATAIGAYTQITNNNTIILGSTTYPTNVGVGRYDPSYKLHVNGTLAGNVAYHSTSDGRFKKDVFPVENALDKVKALRGITFNWNQATAKKAGLNVDALNHYGFIAQDVEKILPQVVNTANDSMQTKSIVYAEIVPVLTQAMKERQALIEQLQQENDELEAQLLLLQQQKESIKRLLTSKNK
jgi:hypothetical protein